MLGYQTKARGPSLYRPLVLCVLVGWGGAGQSASTFSADFTEEDAVETSLDPEV